MASPKKLSHLVLQTNRRPQMIEWYCTVLGAELLYQNPHIAFISYDDEHHRVAFVDPGPLADKAPAEGKTARAGGEVGLHHVAFTMGSLDDLADQYLALKDQGIRPHRRASARGSRAGRTLPLNRYRNTRAVTPAKAAIHGCRTAVALDRRLHGNDEFLM